MTVPGPIVRDGIDWGQVCHSSSDQLESETMADTTVNLNVICQTAQWRRPHIAYCSSPSASSFVMQVCDSHDYGYGYRVVVPSGRAAGSAAFRARLRALWYVTATSAQDTHDARLVIA
ncbi:jg9237 [Pararge aegeria aegeria]|uniref:Jg9237 protein n=1 Tax=Pararge aegeria aegeria TaxID=348720 RepID=A0A8S4SHI8_9NEOP|nr:jg9237 [Pararge aegeria aegeria]